MLESERSFQVSDALAEEAAQAMAVQQGPRPRSYTEAEMCKRGLLTLPFLAGSGSSDLPNPWESEPGLSAELGVHVKLFQQP